MKNSVCCVIPNWNGKDLISDCLNSLQAQSEPVHIIVVDNGSVDGSVELIDKQFPEVELIKLDKNHGFAGGVNAGITSAIKNGAKYVALFNNDAVADKDWLKNLVNCANKNPSAGIITCKFMRMDKTHIDSTGDFYTIWGLPFPRGRNEMDKGQYDDKTDVFGASGGASLYRVAMLNQIGLFDEDFFAYFEDVDISFRAQLAGWKVRYEPKAVAYHHVGGTSSGLGNFARYHSTKNTLMLYAKNMPTKLYIKYLPLFCLQFSRMLVSSILRGHLWTFLKGTAVAIKLYPRTVKKRREIQKSRKVSIEYIDRMLYHHRPPRPPILEQT